MTRMSWMALAAPAAGLIMLAATGAASADDAQSLLDAHNGFRDRYCVPAMTWSSDLAASAQSWAEGCSMSHSSGGNYGENLAWGANLDAAYAVQLWTDEAGQYDYAYPAFSGSTGHFTQVVWRGSTELGCGMAACNGQNFWVCRYSPSGNYEGQFPDNVPQACK